MLKTTIYLKKSKKDLWFSQLAKGIFSELRCYGYEYYCIVGFSLCKEYDDVKDFALTAF